MKRSTVVLAALTALVLLLSMPGALRDALDRGGLYLFSRAFLEDLPKRLTVGENLAVFADLYGLRRPAERIDAVIADCDLAGLVKRPYGSLSAGQRTRVSLAKAVLNEPEVLLLDEPTASLDPDIGDRMRTYLERYQRRTGCTMLLASHHMGEVERMCDDVIMLRAGVVVDQGSPAELIARYGRADMEEVFLDIARGVDDEPGADASAENVAM